MKKSVLALLLAVIMAAALLTVGAFAADPEPGTAGKPFTTVQEYKDAVTGNAWDGKDVYLKIDGKTFTEGQFNLPNVQSRVNPPKLHLTITNCEFTGNTSGDTYGNTSFMYLSNCQELRIDNCKFDAGTAGLVYGINWNLIQIKDAVVTITNCSFEGKFSKNPLKLNQRNGADDVAKDIKQYGPNQPWEEENIIAASIESAVIDNCTFNCTKDGTTPNNVIQLGSAGKGDDGAAAPSTGGFPVTIATGSNEVTIEKAYNAAKDAEIPTVAVPANSVVTKTESTDTDPVVNNSAAVFTINERPFMTLSAAISAADDGDTIHMLQSYDATNEGTVTFDSGKDVTLNLGGYTLTVKRFNLTHGWLTVENGNVHCDGQAFNVFAASTAQDELYTKLVIKKGVTINAAYGICLFPGSGKAGYSSSIEVYGNIATGGIFVSGNIGGDAGVNEEMRNHMDDLPTVNVYEGAIVSGNTTSQGIALNGLAVVNINGGLVEGTEAVGVKSGILKVNGGTLVANGKAKNPAEANNNGTEDTGAAISITGTYSKYGEINVNISDGFITSQKGNALYLGHSSNEGTSVVYGHKVTVEINGGEFEGELGAVYIADPIDGDVVYSQKAISGGSFNSSVTAYLADNLKYQLQGSDGMFSYYSNFEDALAAAENDSGAVITYVGSSETAATLYTVTIVYGNGTDDMVLKLPADSYTLPAAPSKPGYIFLGWRNGGTTYGADDTYTLSGDMTFTAVWANMPDVTPSEPDDEPDDEPDVTEFPFDDVSVLAWYYDAVKYVYDNDLMNGTDVNQFSPNSPLTRAMVWAVLARVDGETISGDSWMTEAQAWAVESGVSDGTDPTGYVTREQLVTMLYRFAGEPAGAADISGYPDAASISDWAADAMAWAVKVGLIEGDDVGALNPTANSTRAHAATFFMRFCEL